MKRYKRRLEDVRTMVSMKKIDKADDLFVWKWLEKLILHLSVMGMSSDDTEVEVGSLQKKFAARALPWRENVAGPMRKIDSLRKPGEALEKTKGLTAEPRVLRRDAPSTGRDHQRGFRGTSSVNAGWRRAAKSTLLLFLKRNFSSWTMTSSNEDVFR
jgi:hypothetical protein